jgi:hypothetical protein
MYLKVFQVIMMFFCVVKICIHVIVIIIIYLLLSLVTQSNPQGGPNLHIFKSECGELVKDFIHKKQIGW